MMQQWPPQSWRLILEAMMILASTCLEKGKLKLKVKVKKKLS
jgi:hypothetical protein